MAAHKRTWSQAEEMQEIAASHAARLEEITMQEQEIEASNAARLEEITMLEDETQTAREGLHAAQARLLKINAQEVEMRTALERTRAAHASAQPEEEAAATRLEELRTAFSEAQRASENCPRPSGLRPRERPPPVRGTVAAGPRPPNWDPQSPRPPNWDPQSSHLPEKIAEVSGWFANGVVKLRVVAATGLTAKTAPDSAQIRRLVPDEILSLRGHPRQYLCGTSTVVRAYVAAGGEDEVCGFVTVRGLNGGEYVRPCISAPLAPRLLDPSQALSDSGPDDQTWGTWG